MDSRTIITFQGRTVRHGKTAQYAANIERVHREVLPMSNASRLAGYEKTNAGRPLSGRQIRRLARHDAYELPPDVQCMIKNRDHSRKPIRQRFELIDNQRKPTGRVGAARFGPQQGIEGLRKLLFAPRKSLKGMDLDEGNAASQLGRMKARTGSGRRRLRRHSSRGR